MKIVSKYPFMIYLTAGFACLCIMIIVDYVLGTKAEHLNAWAIITRIFGNDTGIEDSLAIREFGLVGATLLMLASNAVFGVILIQLIKLFIRITNFYNK